MACAGETDKSWPIVGNATLTSALSSTAIVMAIEIVRKAKKRWGLGRPSVIGYVPVFLFVCLGNTAVGGRGWDERALGIGAAFEGRFSRLPRRLRFIGMLRARTI